jgi:hypothetical protein
MRRSVEPIYPRDTLFKVLPNRDGTRSKYATDPKTGESEETYMSPFADGKLRTKAILRRKRVY